MNNVSAGAIKQEDGRGQSVFYIVLISSWNAIMHRYIVTYADFFVCLQLVFICS